MFGRTLKFSSPADGGVPSVAMPARLPLDTLRNSRAPYPGGKKFFVHLVHSAAWHVCNTPGLSDHVCSLRTFVDWDGPDLSLKKAVDDTMAYLRQFLGCRLSRPQDNTFRSECEELPASLPPNHHWPFQRGLGSASLAMQAGENLLRNYIPMNWSMGSTRYFGPPGNVDLHDRLCAALYWVLYAEVALLCTDVHLLDGEPIVRRPDEEATPPDRAVASRLWMARHIALGFEPRAYRSDDDDDIPDDDEGDGGPPRRSRILAGAMADVVAGIHQNDKRAFVQDETVKFRDNVFKPTTGIRGKNNRKLKHHPPWHKLYYDAVAPLKDAVVDYVQGNCDPDGKAP